LVLNTSKIKLSHRFNFVAARLCCSILAIRNRCAKDGFRQRKANIDSIVGDAMNAENQSSPLQSLPSQSLVLQPSLQSSSSQSSSPQSLLLQPAAQQSASMQAGSLQLSRRPAPLHGVTFSVRISGMEHSCMIADCALKRLYAFEGTTLDIEHVYRAYESEIHKIARGLILSAKGKPQPLLILRAPQISSGEA
jgi:hypothetical protein